MIRAKSYENAYKFVKVTDRMLTFFFGHGVHNYTVA